jgi:ligand-binding SRPBCC domain-containing protein
VGVYRIERVQVVPRRRSEVFAFFADPANLEQLTPPSLRFTILTPAPIEMAVGARIDYRIKLSGIPLRWRTRIAAFEPEQRFIDVQERGPYKLWHHTHVFRELGEDRTEIHDIVHYEVGFGPLGRAANALFVHSRLDEIFEYRATVMRQLFG